MKKNRAKREWGIEAEGKEEMEGGKKSKGKKQILENEGRSGEGEEKDRE